MNPGLHRPKQNGKSKSLECGPGQLMPRIGFDLQDKRTSLKWQATISFFWERRQRCHPCQLRGHFLHLKLLAAQVSGQNEMSRWSQHATLLPAIDASGHNQAHPCRLPSADRPEPDRPTLDEVVLLHRKACPSPSKKQTNTKTQRRGKAPCFPHFITSGSQDL